MPFGLVTKFLKLQRRSGRGISIALPCGHHEGLGVNIDVPDPAGECPPVESRISA
jgi:hypothetical protein